MKAVEDYKKSYKRLKADPEDMEAQDSIDEIEEFFYSDWLKMLTDIDGERILNHVKGGLNSEKKPD